MGPPGSGKTTLISDYLERRHLTTIWYQADTADTDAATFFHYLGVAARKAAPRYRRPLPQYSPERRTALELFAREFFGILFARLQPPFAIVLDNYQEIPASADLHELLRIAVEALPAEGHIIAVSRKEPPSSLARARVNGIMEVLDDSALKLTIEEAQGIARLRLPDRKARQQVSSLHELTHGWVAGLTLMLEQSAAELPENTAPFRTPGVLFEYFANEVFAKNDLDTQTVLLKSAFLPTMTVRTVAELTGERRAGRILNHLSRNNFFTIRYDLPEPVFQYHPLFREFLLSRARRLPDAELKRLRTRSAAVLEQNRAYESALSIYLDLGAWNEFERCLLLLAPGLLEQGRHQVLAQWLAHIPQAQLAQQAWLLHYLGRCRIPADLDEGRRYLAQAHKQFLAGGNRKGLFANWNVLIGSYLHAWANLLPLAEWITEIEAALEHAPPYPDAETEAETRCTLFVALLYGRPTDPSLPSRAEQVEKLLFASTDARRLARVAPHLFIYYTWWHGDLPRAEVLLRNIESTLTSRGAPASSRIAWHGMAAGLHWSLGDNGKCIAEAALGLDLADSTNAHTGSILLYMHAALASLQDHQTAQTEPYLARLSSSSPLREIDSIASHYLLAGRYFLLGDLPRAHQYLSQALIRYQETGYQLGQLYCMNDLARVIYLQGEHDIALDMLHQARMTALGMQNRCIEYLTWLTEAELALLAGHEDRCLSALRFGLSLGRSLHIHNHPWWRSDVMARLYSRALEHGIETDYVLGMIRKRALCPPEDARESSTWPFPYKIFTLGRFALVKDGRPITFSGKAQSKPLDLLKALVALGGRQVSASHLAEILWPDAEGDAAQRTFDTTLHRLRRLIGDDQVLLMSDGKLSLNDALCWVDTWTIERLMGRLDLFLKQPPVVAVDNAGIAQLASSLLSLYRGPFLTHETSDTWMIMPRERLQNRYLCLLGALSRHWESTENWERAAETYHKMIDVHAEGEEFYQRLMQVYRHLGRPAEAATVYQRCRETLLAASGRTLSATTEALYRELAAAGSNSSDSPGVSNK